jgi:hypothetical protein
MLIASQAVSPRGESLASKKRLADEVRANENYAIQSEGPSAPEISSGRLRKLRSNGMIAPSVFNCATLN